MAWDVFMFMLQLVVIVLAVVGAIAFAAWVLTAALCRPRDDFAASADTARFIDPVPVLADGLTAKPGPPVTVATYGQPIDAHMDRILLESHDIPVFIADEGLIGTDWFYSNAIGGAKLQVPEPYAETARRLLADDAAASPALIRQPEPAERAAQSTGDLCPVCGSDQVYRVRNRQKWVYISLLFLNFPVPVTGTVRQCDHCGHEWN